jgi:hypothetical protein
MRKLFVGFQWAIVLAFVAFLVYMLVRPEPQPDYEPETWKSWKGFYALAYTGVADKEGGPYVTRKQLARQLDALHEAGYRTITPEDAAAFLEGRAPLPPKALLLLFEGGRKDSFLRATPELREVGYIAALCIPTEVTRRWGAFYLKKDDLKRVAKLSHWRLCSMGHAGTLPISVDASGVKGHFLSDREWLGERVEDDAAFRHRVEQDYDTAARVLEGVNDGPVAAYVYPYADWGAAPDSESFAARVNRDAVSAHHRIAFAHVGDAFNAFGADPFGLARLRVSSQWDAARLLAELESYSPRTEAVSMEHDRGFWTFSGPVDAGAAELVLEPAAAAWVRGSDAWTDVDVAATVGIDSGGIGAIYARHSGPRSYVRLVLTGDGVQLQERVGDRTRTLAGKAVDISPGSPHSLRLRVKGRRAWVWLDEEPIGGPLPVAGVTEHGRVGVGGQGAKTTVSRFAALPIRADFVFADRFSSLSAGQQQDAIAVLAPWFAQGSATGLSDEQQTDALKAAAAGVETIPVVNVVEGIGAAAADALAGELAGAVGGPVLGRLVTRFAVREPGTVLANALRARGYQIIHVASPEQAIALAEAGRVPPDDLLLIDGPEGDILGAIDRLLHFVPATHIIAAVAEQTALPAWMGRAVRQTASSQP